MNGPLDELYRRPGFLIRRANQIAVSLFLEETGALGITNSQYGILLVLKHHAGIDQISVAKLLGLDRSTTGLVLDKLEKAGLIVVRREGRERWNHLDAVPIKRIHDRWIGPYAERAVELLDRLKRDLES